MGIFSVPEKLRLKRLEIELRKQLNLGHNKHDCGAGKPEGMEKRV